MFSGRHGAPRIAPKSNTAKRYPDCFASFPYFHQVQQILSRRRMIVPLFPSLFFPQKIRVGILLALLFLSALAGPAAHAAAAQEERYHDWILRCDDQLLWAKQCSISQSILLQETGQNVLRVVAGTLAEDKRRILHLTLPLALYLPAGVALKIDDQTQTIIPVETCTAGGCELAIPLDPPLLHSLQKAQALRVGFLDAVSRRQITVTVSLHGFSEAFAALTKK